MHFTCLLSMLYSLLKKKKEKRKDSYKLFLYFNKFHSSFYNFTLTLTIFNRRIDVM